MAIRKREKNTDPMNNTSTLKVFITDDHPVVINGLKAFFQNHSSIRIVGVARSASEMFERLEAARPNVLLLDLNLPGTDFYDNIHQLRQRFPWVKIVIFSGYQSQDLVRSLRQAGIDGYLTKAIELDELANALHRVMGNEEVIIESPLVANVKDDFSKRLTLSRREQEILRLISRGLSSQRIGKTLFISKHTVETHRKNMLRKLDFNTSTELVKFAVQHGLV